MSSRAQIKVYGKTYQIKTDSLSVPPKDLAHYVDSRMHELAGSSAKHSTIDIAILTALNIAQELMAAQEELKSLKTHTDSEQADRENRMENLVRQLRSEMNDNS